MAESTQIDTWITSARDGDRSALTKLMAAFHPQLRRRAEARLAPSIKRDVDPDDILQEVYMDVARRFGRFENRGPAAFRNWLHAILDQKLVDAQRFAHRQKRDAARRAVSNEAKSSSYFNLLERVYTESGRPSRIVRHNEALSALLASLNELSAPHRQVLELRFLEGLSVCETADRMRKTEAAVVALTKRALGALRQRMDQRGEFTRGV